VIRLIYKYVRLGQRHHILHQGTFVPTYAPIFTHRHLNHKFCGIEYN